MEEKGREAGFSSAGAQKGGTVIPGGPVDIEFVYGKSVVKQILVLWDQKLLYGELTVVNSILCLKDELENDYNDIQLMIRSITD